MSYLDDLSLFWNSVLKYLEDKLTAITIEMWFSKLEIRSYENNVITLDSDSEFNIKIVKEQYLDYVKDGFEALFGFRPEIEFNYTGTETSIEKISKQFGIPLSSASGTRQGDDKRPISDEKLEETPRDEVFSGESSTDAEKQSDNFGALPLSYNFEYTFDNFIVGNSNKFAHAACLAVADRPARDYNPLFIYGPSGLGKTHLLSAIVNKIKEKKPDAKVIYIKGDDFTNQMVESLSKHQMPEFHNKYRSCDILLIDDIQFIAGKTSTQEEFFHTFNTLYEEHKQIILTSDRPPKDIQPLEERLRSRFEWGIIADIQPPDIELRIAIIKKKAEQVSITIPDDVLTFLAENLRSNIRQLEGAIKKLSAQSFVYGNGVTMELAKSCLGELLGGAEPVSVTVDKIFSAVSKKYNVEKDDISGSKRNKEIAMARHVAIYLIREITEMSYSNIGKLIGGRDHTTVLNSWKTIGDKMMTDPILNIDVTDLISDITERP